MESTLPMARPGITRASSTPDMASPVKRARVHRHQKSASSGGGRSWSGAEERYLIDMRQHKMPYKHIAAQLKKTELACRLHYHQISFGSKARRSQPVQSPPLGTISAISSGDHEVVKIQPSRDLEAGTPSATTTERSSTQQMFGIPLPSSSAVAQPTPGGDEQSVNEMESGTSPSHARLQDTLNPDLAQRPGQRSGVEQTVAALPRPLSNLSPSTTIPEAVQTVQIPLAHARFRSDSEEPLRLDTRHDDSHARHDVDISRLERAYNTHRVQFWSTIAHLYGGDVSPATLEEAWRKSVRHSPARSTESTRSSGSMPVSSENLSTLSSPRKHRLDHNIDGNHNNGNQKKQFSSGTPKAPAILTRGESVDRLPAIFPPTPRASPQSSVSQHSQHSEENGAFLGHGNSRRLSNFALHNQHLPRLDIDRLIGGIPGHLGNSDSHSKGVAEAGPDTQITVATSGSVPMPIPMISKAAVASSATYPASSCYDTPTTTTTDSPGLGSGRCYPFAPHLSSSISDAASNNNVNGNGNRPVSTRAPAHAPLSALESRSNVHRLGSGLGLKRAFRGLSTGEDDLASPLLNDLIPTLSTLTNLSTPPNRSIPSSTSMPLSMPPSTNKSFLHNNNSSKNIKDNQDKDNMDPNPQIRSRSSSSGASTTSNTTTNPIRDSPFAIAHLLTENREIRSPVAV